jgi:hypothetical protein
MIEIRGQRSQRESAFPESLTVACMLLQHLVVQRNSQLNRGEPLGEIACRQTNDGVFEQWRIPNLVPQFSGRVLHVRTGVVGRKRWAKPFECVHSITHSLNRHADGIPKVHSVERTQTSQR